MKKNIFAILICVTFIISIKCVNAQIFLNGSPNPFGLTTELEVPFNVVDVGTSTYARNIPTVGTEYIFRKDGYWHHTTKLYYSQGGYNYYHLKTVDQHFTNNPPCAVSWYNNDTNLVTLSDNNTFPVQPTGAPIEQILTAGTCSYAQTKSPVQ